MKKKTVLLSVLSIAAIVTCVATAMVIKVPKALYNAKAEPLKITFDHESFCYLDGGDYFYYIGMEEYTEIDNLSFTNFYDTDFVSVAQPEDVRLEKDSYNNDCIFSVKSSSSTRSGVALNFLFDEEAATLTRIIFSVLIDNVPNYDFNKDNVDVSDYGGMGKTISIYSGSDNYYSVPTGSEITFVSITFEYTC